MSTLLGTVGAFSRYAVYQHISSRPGIAPSFVVEDAEQPDETGLPSVIRQSESLAEATEGLVTQREYDRLFDKTA